MTGKPLARFIGHRFGYLVVEEVYRKVVNGRGRTIFKVECDCGTEKEILSQNLTHGTTKSCGCRTAEMKVNYKHGLWGKRIYQTYQDMLQRCFNPNNARYHRYGGRGITVCDEWAANIVSFYEWAMANGYTDELTIERIDNDGDYCPENCKWATMQEQLQNRDTRGMGRGRNKNAS